MTIEKVVSAVHGNVSDGFISLIALPTHEIRIYSPLDTKKLIEDAITINKRTNVYFSVNPIGKKPPAGKRGASGDVSSVACVWVDIDCAGGTHSASNLPTKQQAIEYLDNFGFEPSIIVWTGGGYHAYWLFDQVFKINTELQREEIKSICTGWVSGIANDFAGLKWKLDPVGDLPRILRIPASLNFKKVIKGEATEPDIGKIERFNPDLKYSLSLLKQIIEGKKQEKQENTGEFDQRLYDVCGFLKFCRDNAENLPNPEWHRALCVLAFAEGGVEEAHKISSPHPKYRPLETQKKIKNALKCAGPATCQRIRTDFPLHCDDCKFRAKNPLLALTLSLKKQPAADDSKKEKKENIAGVIINLCSEYGIELFCDEYKVPFARIPVRNHLEVYPIKDNDMKMWLTQIYFSSTGTPPSADNLSQVIGVLSARATFEGGQKKLGLRVSGDESAIWYDLANQDWQAVKIDKTGWSIEDKPDALFFRRANTSPQVLPKKVDKAEIWQIMDYININDEELKLLFLVDIITCFIPDIPHAVTILHGDHGSAKSTAMRVRRKIIDPARMELHILPRDEDELGLVLSNNWAPAFDNLDGMSSGVSDVLCMAATGGGFSKRELYTNSDEVIFNFKRCVCLNGIVDPASRADLIDRSIFFKLARIPESKRRTEEFFWREFAKVRPRILGAIFSIIADALLIKPTINLPVLPRMADLALWGFAIAESIVEGGGEIYINALNINRDSGNVEAIHSSPVAQVITTFMAGKVEWGPGSAADLLKNLEPIAVVERVDMRSKSWPQSASSLARKLKYIRTTLAAFGIHVIENSDPHNHRLIYHIQNCQGEKHPLGDEVPLNQVNLPWAL